MFRQDRRLLLWTTLFCIPINQAFFLHGVQQAPTSHAALIYAICPLVVLFLAVALGEERLEMTRLTGVAISVLGVIVIGLGNFWMGGSARNAVLRGDLLILGAVVSWGFYLTLNKWLVERHGALPALAGTFVLGCAVQLLVAALTTVRWPVWSSISWTAWQAVFYLAFVASGMGLVFQNLAIHRMDASQVATANNAGPILTVGWGILFFQEQLSAALIVGGIMTLGGILWTAWSRTEYVGDRRPEIAAELESSA
jgi:drug/metabolite transporter (DMT)-like permease